jgi:hypothetical protein
MAERNTKKHRDFIGEPMKNKLVTTVPGIGPVLGQSLTEADFETAKKLYGRYLSDPDGFKDFIKSHGGDGGQQQAAYNAMKEWDDQHN